MEGTAALLNRKLNAHLDAIEDAVQNPLPSSWLSGASWGVAVVQNAKKLTDKALYIANWWNIDENPRAIVIEAHMETFGNSVKDLIRVCLGSMEGGGTTLLSYQRESMQNMVEKSKLFLTKLTSCYDKANAEAARLMQEASLEVSAASNTIAMTPGKDSEAISRSLREVIKLIDEYESSTTPEGSPVALAASEFMNEIDLVVKKDWDTKWRPSLLTALEESLNLCREIADIVIELENLGSRRELEEKSRKIWAAISRAEEIAVFDLMGSNSVVAASGKFKESLLAACTDTTVGGQWDSTITESWHHHGWQSSLNF